MKDKKRPWTPAEIADLVKMWGQDLGVTAIALCLKRRPAVVRAYAQQDREAQVRGGVVEIETLPDFDEDPAPAPVKADPPPSAPGGR